MNGLRLRHSNRIKYLGIYIDETLSGNEHCEELVKKLSWANGIIAKASHYAPLKHLRNIYFATFSSNLYYGSQVCGLTSQTVIDKISLLQRKAIKIMAFSDARAHSDPLFKELKILKSNDNIFLQNCIFVHHYFHGKLPTSFNNIFNKVNKTHTLFTRNANDGKLTLPTSNSTKYGLKSIMY